MVLLDLSNKGMLRQGEWKKASTSNNYSEKQLVLNMVELCVYMYNNDEMQLMRDGRQSTDEALELVFQLKLEKKLP